MQGAKKSANHALNLLCYNMVKLDLKLHPIKTKIAAYGYRMNRSI